MCTHMQQSGLSDPWLVKMWLLIALTLSMQCNFSCFGYHLLTFFKINFPKVYCRNTITVSNGLDLDQGPDLDPNYLQWLSADIKSWQ